MKKVLKKVLPFMLALMVVFGSCITVSAAESPGSATLDLSRLKGAVTGNDYALYKYQCVYTDGSNFYLMTSTYPINAQLKISQALVTYTYYHQFQFLGDYAVYKVPFDYSTLTVLYHGRVSAYTDLNLSSGSVSGYPSMSVFQSAMLAANFDLVGRTYRQDRDYTSIGEYDSFFSPRLPRFRVHWRSFR